MLGPRLAAVARLIPPGARVADIGTDHALLPIHLLRSGISPRVIAVEKTSGPLDAARRAVAAAGLEAVCAVRAGDGLGPVKPGEADAVVIAGMGGPTMAGILDGAPAGVLDGVRRLILQPIRAAAVRRWLYAHGWRQVEEELAAEGGRLYVVMAAERGAAETPDEILLEVGPLLWARRHPLLRRYLTGLAARYTKILESTARGRTGAAGAARARVRAKLEQLEELIQCL